MSFALTTRQLLDGSKTVTRRKGWTFLRVGDKVQAIDKLDFRRKGGSKVLGICTIVAVRRERIDAITDADCAREGFPGRTAEDFVPLFCQKMRVTPDMMVTRIEFTFEPAQPSLPGLAPVATPEGGGG